MVEFRAELNSIYCISCEARKPAPQAGQGAHVLLLTIALAAVGLLYIGLHTLRH